MAARISASLSALADSHGCGLMITTSRRTGARLMAALAPLANRADTVLWQGDGPNPYLGFLGLADAIIVTADSINMVSEACSTGKPVHLLPLGAESRRRAAFLQVILASGRARAFNGSLEIWDYTPLRETERVAGLLVTQLRNSGILA
jgi:mitochondrial fission protein ELM1